MLMTRARAMLLFLAFMSACASPMPAEQTLEDRMLTLSQRHPKADAALEDPDSDPLEKILSEGPRVRGKIVRVLGDKIAVRLDFDTAALDRLPVDISCYRGKTYKGELTILEFYQGLAVGEVRDLVPGTFIRIGDKVTTWF